MQVERPTSRWKERLKDLLDMHREERRGVRVLMGVLLVLLGWVVYEQWLRPPKQHDLTEQRAWVEAVLAMQEAARADTVAPAPFPFDPNTIGREEWKVLGLSDRQVDGVERYLGKGGRFRTKKDLARMYSIWPEQFAALEPFILLPDSQAPKVYQRRDHGSDRAYRGPSKEGGSTIMDRAAYGRTVRRMVEVNTADTLALIALPGIGPTFARGIVRYRDRLGGFVSLEQLGEVYVLQDKPDAVLKLKEFLILDTLAVRRIPINTCTAEDLASHPYARWAIAKPLVAYRQQHGPFKQLSDIKRCVAVTPEVFAKLAPYLSLE